MRKRQLHNRPLVLGGCLTAIVLVVAAESEAQLVILDDLLALTQASSSGEGGGIRHETASFGHIPGSGSERIQELRPAHAEYHEMGLRRRLNPDRFAPPGPRRLRVGGAQDEEERDEGVISRLAGLRQEPTRRFQPAPFGVLDVPSAVDEGPADGLTLDMAIQRVLDANLELRTDVMELYMADADIHAASRFNNPLLFYASDGMPYDDSNPKRENEIAHDFTIVYPLDVTGTRRSRTDLARRARTVIGAQYTNTVRMEIDELYERFVNVLEARETIRFASAGLQLIEQLMREVERQISDGQMRDSDLQELASLEELTMLAIRQGQRDEVRAKRHLAEILNLDPMQAHLLPVRGAIRVPSPPPPLLPVILDMAMQNRPDLQAYRLGIGHAEANVSLNRAHVFKELFVFFTPITYEDRSRANELSTQGWGAGVMFEMPFFDFNRGQIRHAEYNVIRTQREVELLSRRIVTEVQDAHQDYVDSFEDLMLMEQNILPRALRNRNAALDRYVNEGVDLDDTAQALSDYEEIVRIYKDAIVRHRRSMLHMNTAVGCRIMP